MPASTAESPDLKRGQRGTRRTGRLDPARADSQLDFNSPFAGFGDTDYSAGSTPGGGGLPMGPGLSDKPLASLPGTTIGGNSMAAGGWKSWLAKNGLDLALGGMSLFGGDDEQQQRSSYNGAGIADPRTSLQQALMAITRLGAGLETRTGQPRTLTPSVGRGPAPVNVAGVQIGGGLGNDPAMRSRIVDSSWMNMFQPFQGLAQQQFGQAGAGASNPGARRRQPGGGQ
jgi:hypothetical protein